MTAGQMKRIRARLAKMEELAREAHELALAAGAPSGLRFITARAADETRKTTAELHAMDQRDAMEARESERLRTTRYRVRGGGFSGLGRLQEHEAMNVLLRAGADDETVRSIREVDVGGRVAAGRVVVERVS